MLPTAPPVLTHPGPIDYGPWHLPSRSLLSWKRGWRFCLSAFCVVLFQAAALLAQEPTSATVNLWLTTGEQLTGSQFKINGQQLTVNASDQVRNIPVPTVWQMSLAPGTTRPPRPRFWLHLTNGDRWGVSAVTLAEEVLEFHLPSDEQPELPRKLGVEFIAGIQLLRPGTSWRTDESEWRHVANQREKSDLLVLRNGDRLLGDISELGSSTLELTGTSDVRKIEWPAVAGLLLNPDLAEVPQPAPQGWIVLLADDSWLTATAVESVTDGHLKLTGVEGIELSIPTANIRWMTRWGAESVPLSRLPMAEQKHAPRLGVPLEVIRNRNARGLPLRLDPQATILGQTHATSPLPALCPLGLGMSSGMTVRWTLDAKYRRFQCGFGLDATAGPEGHAVVTLRVDDHPPQTITLRAGEPLVLETQFDLTGARSLMIETDYGENADASDWINLYAPILVP